MKIQSKIINSVTGLLTAVIDGKIYTHDRSHPGYYKMLEALKQNSAEDFIAAESLEQYIIRQVDKGVTYKDGKVFYNGEEIHSVLVDQINALREDGYEIDYMIKFLENLMQNPSMNSVNQLYKFLEHRNMPIDEEGCFYAYKAVRNDYYDKYSGTVLNTVGEIIKCDRNQVDDDPKKTCSKGYHVGALSYSGPNGWYYSHGDKVMIVKVNPKNVVAVPDDHSATKLRVCEYEVIAEYTVPLSNSVYNQTVHNTIYKSWDDILQ